MSKKGIIATLLAGSFWGLISIFTKNLNAYGFSALQIAFFRVGISSLIMLVVTGIEDPGQLRIRLKDLWMFVGTGIISLQLFNFFYFTTIEISEVSIAVALLYTSPVFIMILSAVLFDETVTKRKLLALIITVAGCSLSAGILGSRSLSVKVLLMGTCSGFFYGLYSIFSTYALKRYSSKTITLYTFLLAFIGSGLTCHPVQALKLAAGHPQSLMWAVGLSAVSTVIPYTLYTYGISQLNSQLAAIFVTIEPVVGNLIGLLIWKEPVGLVRWLGMFMIVGAMVILNMPDKKVNQ